MDKRRTELSKLSSYIQSIDTEVTMILQSLQWDRQYLIEGLPMAPCRYDCSHTVPPNRLDIHERECRLRSAGYSTDEQLLPEPLDAQADTLITLNKDDITNIIEYAAKIDPLFQKGHQGRGPEECQPLTLERLQHAYSMDERRAIHDAVVNAVPSCHHLLELALPHGEGSQPGARSKSRAAVLAELRDMKRRRTKYRGAAKTRNYSDVLRDLIATQMEHYSETQSAVSDAGQPHNLNTNKETNRSKKYEEVHIKEEPVEGRYREPESRQKDKPRDTHKEREREKKYGDYKRDKHRDERDRYSSSSKESNRDRNYYRSRDRHRKDETGDSSHSRTREYKDSSKPSRYSDSKDKHERSDRHGSDERSHRQDRYKRYYDFKQEDYEFNLKRMKREKD
ncbi:U11/U12 small nuclear ribonucleoprotein 48 kDa protein-like isoform X1 [Choristoneura fumiferana]|uniref:U11/U12 small nuclear ribonucleoprotein 48 kDa protein-like isoform X1 n=1 Tax=Choristoneura fumiferana TaxID=7141 RepID=UPI003D15824D